MVTIIPRLLAKISEWGFRLGYQGKFRSLGPGARLLRPFRVDGMENISIGRQTFIQKDAWLYAVGIDGEPSALSIGSKCVFGYNNHITCVRSLTIGDAVLTANNVYISDNVHDYRDVSKPIIQQPVRFKGAVSIGDGSWLGENVCIIGAKVGRNCAIGANSVVTRDIPDFSVAVGAPARVIRQYNPQSQEWEAIRDKMEGEH